MDTLLKLSRLIFKIHQLKYLIEIFKDKIYSKRSQDILAEQVFGLLRNRIFQYPADYLAGRLCQWQTV